MTTNQKIELIQDYINEIKNITKDLSIEVKKAVLSLEYQLKLEKLFEGEE